MEKTKLVFNNNYTDCKKVIKKRSSKRFNDNLEAYKKQNNILFEVRKW